MIAGAFCRPKAFPTILVYSRFFFWWKSTPFRSLYYPLRPTDYKLCFWEFWRKSKIKPPPKKNTQTLGRLIIFGKFTLRRAEYFIPLKVLPPNLSQGGIWETQFYWSANFAITKTLIYHPIEIFVISGSNARKTKNADGWILDRDVPPKSF